MSQSLPEDLREILLRGTIYDSELEVFLDEGSEEIRSRTDPDDVLGVRPDREPSVLVSLSPHALHYLDLRIALLMRNLHDAGVDITLVLRDHQTLGHPNPNLSFPQGKGRLLGILRLLGVPTQDIDIVVWTDLASRLALDDDLYAFLEGLDTRELGERLEACPPEFRSFTEAYSTLLDIYMASKEAYHPSRWLIGGPTRYPLHEYGLSVYREVFDEDPVGTLPLPPLPFLPSLPSIAPETDTQKQAIHDDCKDLDREELIRLHVAFFSLVEDSLDVTLDGRKALPADLSEVETTLLRGHTVDALQDSLEQFQDEVRGAAPEEHLQVPHVQMPEVLDALGHDPRRFEILTTLMGADDGLQAKEILERLRLPESKMSTLRRDLRDLKEANLVTAEGVKPITYHPAARRIELEIKDNP